jgi:hypothetical protein
MSETEPTYWITRFLFQRSLGVIYLVGFLILWNQFLPLCGDHGITPARLYMQRLSFWEAPSIFWWKSGDAVFKAAAGGGLVLSILAVAGITDAFSSWISALAWFLLWVLYSSFVNIGGTFYGFGWEIMLGEVGFLAIFLGSMRSPPSVITMWLLRWVLFRLMFGAGLIKIRGDQCWRDLTCMQYHYETQPLPGPLSWWFHWLPAWFHKVEVAFTHFVELVVPFAYFGPRPFRHWAGILTIAFQATLIATGNLSWLNCITIVVAIACFDDTAFRFLLGLLPPIAVGGAAQVAGLPAFAIWAYTAVVVLLSVKPVMNLLSPNQAMNTSFDPFHLVNTYGAFGSVTKTRYEIILEGTTDATITPETKWMPYEFKGKPGDPARRPPQVTPYHYKIDWQMWFAAMSSYQYNPWILNLTAKLLRNDPATLSLIGPNPVPTRAPEYVRAELYEYRYTKPGERDGKWWKRERVGPYLPPLSLKDPQFSAILESQGWNE